MGARPALVLLLLVAVSASAIMLAASHRWGLGVSYDSVVYVQASHSLTSIPLPQPRDQGSKALYWWAPGYPLALRVFGGSYSGARYLNALLLLIGTVVVGGTAWKAIDARAGVLAAVLYAFSPAVFAAHLDLLAEPLFLVLGAAGIALIAARRPVPAGLAAGAATLTRYAGVPLIIVGALVLRGRDRVRFLMTSLALYLGWLVRNELVAGQLSGRQLRWHPPSREVLESGFLVFVHLLITPGRLPSIHVPLVNAGALAEVVAAAALGACVVRADRSNPPRLVSVGLTYVVVYCGFVIATVTLFDASTPLDERLLVPVLPPLVVTIAWLGRGHVAAAVLVSMFALGVAQEARTFSLDGLNYSGRIWSQARISSASLPGGALYSNWPAAVAYFTGRSPRSLPAPVDPHTLAANRQYRDEVHRVVLALRSGRASLIEFEDPEIPSSGSPFTEPGDCRPLTNVVSLCTGPKE